MSEKCACEIAREGIEEANRNPLPYHGVLQDVMDAEIDYARMCDICPCRKRSMERGECSPEPVTKRQQVEPDVAAEEEQAEAQPQHTEEEEEEPDLAHQVEQEEEEEGDVSLQITEFDSDEEPDEDVPREVEEEEECETPAPPPAGSPPCSCDFPLPALKQALEKWSKNTPEAKNMRNPYRPLYDIARSKWMTHEYDHFSWNLIFSLVNIKK